jgi:hypothetical protein
VDPQEITEELEHPGARIIAARRRAPKEEWMSIIARRLVPVAVAVTGLLTFIAVAFAAQPSQYGGTTSQKLRGSPFRITLVASRGAVTNVQLTANVTKGIGVCALESDTSFVFNKGKAKIDRHEKFEGKLTDARGDSMTIKGRVKATSVTGSFIIDSTGGAQGTHTCSSGKVTFSARPGGGEVHHAKYSGAIGPGYPINFRVSANGKAVVGLVLHYELTTCPGGGAGNKAGAFHFKTLKIKSGSFTGASTDHFGSGDSFMLRISGTFFGRVATGHVTGTQRITGVPTCTESEDFTAKAK